MNFNPEFLRVGKVRLEYQWFGPPPDERPTLVFLHEGLGCVSLWRNFPEQLLLQTGCGGLVYSRAGYGKSDPASLPRSVRFMHDEAEILGVILEQTGIEKPILVGHSDGASIALIYAGGPKGPSVPGLILEAPHVFTEPSGLASIAQIREVYRTTDLRQRLARHHGDNTDIAFWGWNDVWLHPAFQAWNIESVLPAITAPMLVIQGEADEYGTWRQIEAIQHQSGGKVQTLAIAGCGHSPHREFPDLVLDAMARFINFEVKLN